MLAVGGAGVTYVARELDAAGEETGPLVAVKILLAARDQGPYLRRLATEARIIQELDHPNIVEYLGFVHRAGHSPYLITRFESGGSLLDHMRRVGTLSVKEAAFVGRQICQALHTGHERGIVHRDLKPENVLLSHPVSKGEDPMVRLADFGIAKVKGSFGSGNTRVGAFVGTPHYAAPEQFVGGTVTEMADVYSVGALLFFCMTARHVVRFADRLDPDDSFQLLCDNLPPVVQREQDLAVDVQRANAVLSVAMAVDPARRCSIVQLDAMFASILSDSDPVIADAVDAPHQLDVGLSSASATGVAAVAALDVAEPSVDPPAPEPPVETPSADRLDAASIPEPLVAEPAPSPAPPVKSSRSLLGGCFKAIGCLFLMVLLALGSMVWLAGSLFGGDDEPVPVEPADAGTVPVVRLTDTESGDAAQADYTAVQRSSANLGDWLRDVCDMGAGDAARVEVVIEPSGAVREAVALSGDDASCVARQITRAEFTRVGDAAVRVELSWQW